MPMPMPRPIELTAPDLSRWRSGNTGVDYVWRFDSGVPGPHLLVQALTHGNEICGAIALDWLLGEQQRWGLRRGRLSVVFANTAAFARWNPLDPDASRFVDEDLNRVWADAVLFGARRSVELTRARELQPFVDAADRLLDLHSMSEAGEPLMVCGTAGRGAEKAVALTRQLGLPQVLLIDTGHPAGLRLIERGGFGDPTSPRTAVLIECGQHWERAAADVARAAVLRFLKLGEVLSGDFLDAEIARLAPPANGQQRLVRVTEAVTARSAEFRFVDHYQGLQVIEQAGTVIAIDGAHEVRTPYDAAVLVMPSTAHIDVGNTMVRIGRLVPLTA